MNRTVHSKIILLMILALFSCGPETLKSEKTLRIMPLGDSITQGQEGHSTYRRPLWKMLDENGFSVNFVGTLREYYPGVLPRLSDFDIDHEGHWGWRADQILGKIDGWAKSASPDIVLIHLGTNDIFRNQPNEETVAELVEIIMIFRKYNPQVKIFVAQIIPVFGEKINVRIRDFNRRFPAMAAELSTEISPVIIVNQYENFNAETDTYDGVHPDAKGAQKMAQKWYDALEEFLPRR